MFCPAPNSLTNTFQSTYTSVHGPFAHFILRWRCFFFIYVYVKCIMHIRLLDYHNVAPAVCETSNPAVLWKQKPSNTNDMRHSSASTSKGPTTKWDARSRAGLPGSSNAAGGERGVQRISTGIAAHAGKAQGAARSMPSPVELVLSSKTQPLHQRL